MTTLHAIQSDDVDWMWPRVESHLSRALLYSDERYSIDSIHDALNAREMQLWVVENNGRVLSATVTQIINYPCKKVLLILLCGGDGVFEWVRLIKTILAWAKKEGCADVEIYGRAGWEKVLEDFGFKKLCVMYKTNL